ncbi:MAG: LacI family DNA-binding transcriptional regulator [Erysipelotrichaceae bacterium]|nr:LacI family DNA-binding transcriptional regulator [Erysipelotrichaceae bacterium]
MSKNKLTMGDIAKMAGVGKTTVSRYFNGGYVKDETREKIRKVVEETHYEPNQVAQLMKAKQTMVMGIITPTMDSTTSARMIMMLDEYVRHYDYTPLIINTNHNELREIKSIENLWKLNVDGIVLLATDITKAHEDMVSKLDIPIIFVGQEYKNGYSIIYNDYQAGYDVGCYAAKMGHKDIVYMGVNPKDEAVGIIRKNGVIDGLKASGVDNIQYLETDFTFETSGRIISKYLNDKIPTLIICATDNIALACYKEIKDRGLNIPDDISLIGFGGYEYSQLVSPSITTIRYDNEDAGYFAGESLLKLINGEEIEKKQVVSYIFMEGESVKKIS